MTKSNEPAWLTLDIILAVHQRQIEEHGGTHGLRDSGLLDSALARPQQLHAYGDPPPDLCALAASYAHGIAKNHAFLDGNKRTAHMAYRLFLAKSGVRMEASQEEKYLRMISLASGELTESEFADWLRTVTK